MAATGATTLLSPQPAWSAAARQVEVQDRRPLDAQLRDLERRYDAKVGVAWLDPTASTSYAYRGDERFAFCSTFKAYAAGAMLQAARDGHVDLARHVHITPDLLLPGAAESSDFQGYAMPLRWFCKVAVVASDNAGGNMMIDTLGGVDRVTAFARSMGDEAFRLDRRETDLNTAIPGDERDTTTPRSMANGYARLLLGDGLDSTDRSTLTAWMKANVTSTLRIRAGLPEGWTSADKTGMGSYGTINDSGLVTRPDGRSFVVCIFTTKPSSGPDGVGQNELVADVTSALVRRLGRS